MQIRLIYGPHHKGQHTGKTFVRQDRPKIWGQMVLNLGQFDLRVVRPFHFEIIVGKILIRHITTLSDNDFKNKMAWVWTALNNP